MKILSSFTSSQVVLNLNEFLFSVKHKLFWRMWETETVAGPQWLPYFICKPRAVRYDNFGWFAVYGMHISILYVD